MLQIQQSLQLSHSPGAADMAHHTTLSIFSCSWNVWYIVLLCLQGGSSVQPVAGTYIWSDLVRVDVVGCAPSTSLAFYGPTTMRVSAMPLVKVRPSRWGFEVDKQGVIS
jgi:hypothetical protein